MWQLLQQKCRPIHSTYTVQLRILNTTNKYHLFSVAYNLPHFPCIKDKPWFNRSGLCHSHVSRGGSIVCCPDPGPQWPCYLEQRPGQTTQHLDRPERSWQEIKKWQMIVHWKFDFHHLCVTFVLFQSVVELHLWHRSHGFTVKHIINHAVTSEYSYLLVTTMY